MVSQTAFKYKYKNFISDKWFEKTKLTSFWSSWTCPIWNQISAWTSGRGGFCKIYLKHWTKINARQFWMYKHFLRLYERNIRLKTARVSFVVYRLCPTWNKFHLPFQTCCPFSEQLWMPLRRDRMNHNGRIIFRFHTTSLDPKFCTYHKNK